MPLNDILTELQRRIIFFQPGTTLPSGPFGFDADPNTATFGGSPHTDGQNLLVTAPLGTRYSQSDGTQWYKKSVSPIQWEKFGAGGASGQLITKEVSETVYVNGGEDNPFDDPDWDWDAPAFPVTFKTIKDALRYGDIFKWAQGATLTIEIEEAYEISEQLDIRYSDYSYVILTTDGTDGIELDTTGWVANSYDYKPFITASSSKLPRINTKIRKDVASDTNTVCLYLYDYVVVNTYIDMEIANFDYAVVAENSILNMEGIDINSCNRGIIANNCIINIDEGEITSILNTSSLYLQLINSQGSARKVKFEESSGGSVNITVVGGYLDISESIIPPVNNNIQTQDGGVIVMRRLFSDDGSPQESYTVLTRGGIKVSQTPNIITKDGVIYSELWNNGTIQYEQTVASDEWTIEHKLGKYPSITILNSNGDLAFAEIDYVNNNEVVLSFSENVTGIVYLN